MIHSVTRHATMLLLVIAILGAQWATAKKLVIVKSGTFGKEYIPVEDNMRFCPTQFSPNGFSILCKDVEGPVVFEVNGVKISTENHAPYAISGDASGRIFPWKSYPSIAKIQCIPSTGDAVSAKIYFSCKPLNSVPFWGEQAGGSPMLIEVDKDGADDHSPQLLLETDVTYWPFPKKPKQLNKPGKHKVLVLPLSKPQKKLHRSKSSPAEAKQRSLSRKCVVIKGDEYTSKLALGWTVDGTAVTYKKNDDSSQIDPVGTAPLTYSFIASSTNFFAITLDLETRQITEHNDVWLQFEGSLDFVRPGVRLHKGKSTIKVLHNEQGRSTDTFGVYFDPWSISTATQLRKGYRYHLVVGGRSTKVTLHRIIMFPCLQQSCQSQSSLWKASTKRCANFRK